MTFLISMFGFAGRMAGDLMSSALGWASSLLFGRVPRSHQVFVTSMMAASFLWLVMLLALILPSIASVLLAATPHPPFVNQAWLGVALLVGVVVLPLAIGFAGTLAPGEGDRPEGVAIVRETLRGYLLAPVISGLLLFLAGVGIARKVRSLRQGWADVHVPIVVKPGGYAQMVADLSAALDGVGLNVKVVDAPWVLTLPAQILSRVSGAKIRGMRPERLQTLTADDLNVGLYPSDIAISGATTERLRARAAILGRSATTSVHLTFTTEGQEIEDELARLGLGAATTGGRLSPAVRESFAAIDAKLTNLPLPVNEWDTLYRLRVQVERDLLAADGSGTEGPGGSEKRPADRQQAAVATSHPKRAEREVRPLAGTQPAAARWALAAVVSFAGFVVVTLLVGAHVVIPFDSPILTLATTWGGQPLLWHLLSESANIPLIVIAVGFVGWLLLTGHRREAVLVVLILAAVTGGLRGRQAAGGPAPTIRDW